MFNFNTFNLGMVSQEQYEYTSFRCAFCQTLNPAKKLRPLAPKLPNEKINSNIQLQKLSSSSSSSDEGNSGNYCIFL